MKTKSRWMMMAALMLMFVIAVGGFCFTAGAETSGNSNGWVTEAPAGSSADFGSNKEWPMTPADRGEGVTEWCFNNGQVTAKKMALDVTKPIVLTYSTKSNVAPDGGSWVMFALTTTFEGATKLTSGIQEEGNAQYRPFFYAHQMKDNRNQDAGGAGSTVVVDSSKYGMLSNSCGAAYDNNAMTSLEIYLGAEQATDGYILVDGLYVGYPTVTQSAYADGNAYLAISAFNSGFFRIKVENASEVTDVKDYALSATATNATVSLQGNSLWRADAGETVTFKIENITEGYLVKSVKANEEVLTAQDGVYSFTMPSQDTVITVETEKAPDMYTVVYEGSIATITFKDGTDTYIAGATVSFTVEVKAAYSLQSVKVDGAVVDEENGYYSFIMPQADAVITVEGVKNYSKPSEQTVSNSVNGWNNEQNMKDPNYGAVVDGNGSSMVDEGSGYSNFVLNNSGSISSVVGFDVTKPIYLDILIMPNGAIAGDIGWFMVGLYDDWNIMLEAGVNGYGTSGTSLDLNEKINEYLKLCFGFNYSDINSKSTPLSSFKNITIASDLSLTNKFGDAWGWTEEGRGTDFDYAKFEIYIGATAEEGYIKIDGVEIGALSVTQSDFHDGTAFVHLMSFYSSRVQAKIYADAELDAQTNVDSRAEIVFAEGTDLDSLMTYDEVQFKVNVPTQYGALVSVDGKELKPDADGNYILSVGYGKSVLTVKVDEMVTVIFETNCGTEVDSVTITKGGTITAPEITREGYTLAWYADEAFQNVFDFGNGIMESCTVYAKWTPVEYSISYYDGSNKIRDLSPVSYTVESGELDLPVPVKEGYIFDGWYTSANFSGEKVETLEAGITGDITLYAKWVEKTEGGCSSGITPEFMVGAIAVLTASVALLIAGKKKKI